MPLLSRQRHLVLTSLGSVASALIGQVLLVLSGILVARYLGPEQRGNLAIISAMAALASAVGGAGLPIAFAQQIASNDLPLRSGVSGAFRVYGVQVAILGIAWTVCAFTVFPEYFPSIDTDIVFLGIAAIPGLLATSYGTSLLQGVKEFRTLNVLRILQPGLYALFLVAILGMQKDLRLIVLGWSVSAFLVGWLFMSAAFWMSRRAPRSELDRAPNWPRLIKFGSRSLIGNLNPFETLRIDQLALGLLYPPGILGYYVVAQAFGNLPRLIAYSVGLVLLPSLATEKTVDGKLRLLRTSTLVVGVANASIVGALLIFMPQLVTLFFGAQYLPSSEIARVLLVGAFFGATRKTLCDGLVGSGYASAGTISEMVMYPVFGGLFLVLVPLHGGVGMALSVVGAQVASLCTATLLVIRYRAKREG